MNTENARTALRAAYPEGVEQTLVLVKPDGVELGIHPMVAAYFEAHQLSVLREERIRFDVSLAYAVYSCHEGAQDFQERLRHMTTGDCKAYVLIGFNAVERTHQLLGSTDPRRAEPTTIRGLFRGLFDPDRPWANLVHASSDLENAVREIEVLFGRYPVEPRDGD